MARIAVCREQMLAVTQDIEAALDKISRDERTPDDLRMAAACAAGLAEFLKINANRMKDDDE